MEYYGIRKSGNDIDLIEKYRKDLLLMKEYYLNTYTNSKFHQEAGLHEVSYTKMNGTVFGGKYVD